MSRSVYKDQLREKLRRQTEDFIAQGGRIDRINPGVSGRDDPLRPPPATHFSGGPRQERTPIPEVVAAIELRKQQKSPTRTSVRPKKPRKELIYDDFGEPLRWQWVGGEPPEKSE